MTDFQALTYAIDLCDRYGNQAMRQSLDPKLAISRDGLQKIAYTAAEAGTRLRELRHLHETPLSLDQPKQQ